MKTFTFPEDKLPAISGLARVTAKKSGSKYLAGLWMEDLHIGLLWKDSINCKLRRPPPLSGALLELGCVGQGPRMENGSIRFRHATGKGSKRRCYTRPF